jgi:hypothetical protein
VTSDRLIWRFSAQQFAISNSHAGFPVPKLQLQYYIVLGIWPCVSIKGGKKTKGLTAEMLVHLAEHGNRRRVGQFALCFYST